MLKKSLRLRASEIEEVLNGGRSVCSAHMQVKWLGGGDSLRSAAIVAKALARKANARNALRRAIYRSLAAIPPLYLPPPRTCAVFPSRYPKRAAKCSD